MKFPTHSLHLFFRWRGGRQALLHCCQIPLSEFEHMSGPEKFDPHCWRSVADGFPVHGTSG